MVVESVDISFSATTRDAERSVERLDQGIERVGRTTSNTGNVMQTFGRNATRWVSAPLAALAGIGIGFNAQVESLQAQFEVLGGSAEGAEQHIQDLTNFASRTPLQLTGLARASQQLQSFGTDSEDVIGQLQMLGDVAGGQQGKLDSLVRAFGRIQAKGKASLEELNIFMEAGVPIIAELAQNFGVTEEAIFDMASSGALSFQDIQLALEDLTSEGGRFNGMMERMSTTTQGKFSTAVDNAKIALGELTESLMPMINDALDAFTRWARNFAEMDDGIQRLIVSVAGIAIAFGPLMSLFPMLSRGFGSLTQAASGFMQGFMFKFNGAIIGREARNMGLALDILSGKAYAASLSFNEAARFVGTRSPLAVGMSQMGAKIGTFASSLGLSTAGLAAWTGGIAAAGVALYLLYDHFTTSKKEAIQMAQAFEETANTIAGAQELFAELSKEQAENAEIVRQLADQYPGLREQLLAYGDDVQGAIDALEELNQAELARARRPFDDAIQREIDLIDYQIEQQEQLARMNEAAMRRSGFQIDMDGAEMVEATIASINHRLNEHYQNLSEVGIEAGELTKSYEQLTEAVEFYENSTARMSQSEALEYIQTATFVLGDQHEITLSLIETYGTIEQLTNQIADQIKTSTAETERANELENNRAALLRQIASLAEQTNAGRLDALVQLRSEIREINDLTAEEETARRRALSVVQQEINEVVRLMELEAMMGVDRARIEIHEQINEELEEQAIMMTLLGEQQEFLNNVAQGGLAASEQQIRTSEAIVEYLSQRLGITREIRNEENELQRAFEDYISNLERVAGSSSSRLDDLRQQLDTIQSASFELDSAQIELRDAAVSELQTQIQEQMDDILESVTVDLSAIDAARSKPDFEALFDSRQSQIEEYNREFEAFVALIASGAEVSQREIDAMVDRSEGIRDIVHEFEELGDAAETEITRLQEIMDTFNVDAQFAARFLDMSDDMIQAFIDARQGIQDIFGPDFVAWLEETMDLSAQEIIDFKSIVDGILQDIVRDTLAQAIDEFEAFGAAIGAGESAADAAAKSIGNLVATFIDKLPQLLLNAGLQMMGVNWKIGLALIAASGLVALAQGFMGGNAAANEKEMTEINTQMDNFNAAFDGLSDAIVDVEEELRDRRLEIAIDLKEAELEIMRQLNDDRLELLEEELDAIKKQADDRIQIIEEGFGEELYLVRQQLERNLISQEQYLETVQGMIAERNKEIDEIERQVEEKKTEVDSASDAADAAERAKQKEIEDMQAINTVVGNIESLLSTADAAASAMADAVSNNPIGGSVEETFKNADSVVKQNAASIKDLMEQARTAGTPEQAAALEEQARTLMDGIKTAASGASATAQPYVEAMNTINRRLNQLRNYKETIDWWNLVEQWDTDAAIDSHLAAYNRILEGNIPASELSALVQGAANSFGNLDISAAAKGADFITNGPQMLLVGDNPGGREQVSVTPLSSPNIHGPSGGGDVHIHFEGPVYGADADELAHQIMAIMKREQYRNTV